MIESLEEMVIHMEKKGNVDASIMGLFEKLASWLSLSENAAPALAALLYEKYTTGRSLSAREISERTGYSRASVGTIMTELVNSGIVVGHRDATQEGRGRRRILYELDGDVSNLFLAGIRRMLQRLQVIRKDIVELHDTAGDEAPVKNLLKDLQCRVDDSIDCLSHIEMFEPV